MKRFSNILLIADAGTDHPAALQRAITLTKNNQAALTVCAVLALAEFSELHVVHAWRLFGESFFRSPRTTVSDAEVDTMVTDEASERKCWLDNLVNTYGVKADKEAVDYVNPQLHEINGDARNIVPTTATELDVDLVVMGTVARTGIDGFLMGNTAETILTQLDCSVLTIKPPGFISPVKPES